MNVEKHQKVDEQAAMDLLKAIGGQPSFMHAALEDLLELVPLMEEHPEDIERAVIGWRPGWSKLCRLEAKELKNTLEELCNHVDKRAIIEAALTIVASIRALEGKEKQVAKVFMRLDPRTRAILALRDAFTLSDGLGNMDYLNVLVNATNDVDVEAVLKDDPVVGCLMPLYRVACKVDQL